LDKEIILKGKVISGNNQGKLFVSLPWVKKQIKTKLGFDSYIGTLNLRLENEKEINILRNTKGITIIPEAGYCEGKCFKALIMKQVKGAVVLPNIPDYPSDLLEVLAPVNLRKTLGLEDGSLVEVTVKIE